MAFWQKLLGPVLRPKPNPAGLSQAVTEWRAQRERLSERFLAAARQTGKPRDMTWIRADVTDPVQFAWEPAGRQLLALAAVEIQWEPVPGGEMDDVEAARIPRYATALFFRERNEWRTHGRVFFNLSPSEAIDRLAVPLEPITMEL